MFRRLLTRWVPGVLWVSTLGITTFLLAVLVVAPLLARSDEANEGWSRILGLFARDVLVRRTALASAVGLVVTACVFFRPPGLRPAKRGADGSASSDTVGA